MHSNLFFFHFFYMLVVLNALELHNSIEKIHKSLEICANQGLTSTCASRSCLEV